MAEIQFVKVTKAFGSNKVIEDLDLTIQDGKFTVLVGASGCGKTTLLRMIAGIGPATSGHVLMDGKDITDLDPAKRDIAMVFQNYAIYPTMTVKENIEFGLKNRKVPKEEREKLIKEYAAVVGLTDYLDRKPGTLSGGQRQRIALARAMVKKPKVFLMDEPLSNLDAKLRNQMRAEIIKLRSRINTTFIYVTHDQTEAMTLGDRIVIMRDGFIQQIGTPQEVFNHPLNLFVAGFIGTPQMNFFRNAKLVRKDGEYAVDLLGRHIVLDAERQKILKDRGEEERDVIVGIRPVHLSIAPSGIPATIDVSEMMGSEMHLHLTVSGQDVIAIIPTAGLTLDAVRTGTQTYFDFYPTLMHLFDPETEKNLF